MMLNRNRFKKSESFKNVEKDLAYIVSKIKEDDELLKLLSLQENKIGKLSEEEKREILKQNVKIVPLVHLEETDSNQSYLTIDFGDFSPNAENPQYRDKFLYFNILCNIETWNMGDFKLRPFQIAGRLDVLFNDKSLVDSYKIRFLSADSLIINDDLGGLFLCYYVTYNIDRDGKDE